MLCIQQDRSTVHSGPSQGSSTDSPALNLHVIHSTAQNSQARSAKPPLPGHARAQCCSAKLLRRHARRQPLRCCAGSSASGRQTCAASTTGSSPMASWLKLTTAMHTRSCLARCDASMNSVWLLARMGDMRHSAAVSRPAAASASRFWVSGAWSIWGIREAAAGQWNRQKHGGSVDCRLVPRQFGIKRRSKWLATLAAAASHKNTVSGQQPPSCSGCSPVLCRRQRSAM